MRVPSVHGLVDLQDVQVAVQDADPVLDAVEDRRQETLALLQLALGLLAPQRVGDVLRDEDQQFAVALGIMKVLLVALDHQDAERALAALQRHAQPFAGGGSDQFDGAFGCHELDLLVRRQQRQARAQDILGQPPAQFFGLGSGVEFIDKIGKAQPASGRIDQGDVEIAGIKQAGHDAMDRRVERVHVFGLAGFLRDLEESRLQDFRLAMLVDLFLELAVGQLQRQGALGDQFFQLVAVDVQFRFHLATVGVAVLAGLFPAGFLAGICVANFSFLPGCHFFHATSQGQGRL